MTRSEGPPPGDDAAYVANHRVRAVATFDLAARELPRGGSVASIGISPFDAEGVRRFGRDRFTSVVPSADFAAGGPTAGQRMAYFDLTRGTDPPSETYDLVIMAEVLEHLPGDDRRILARVGQLLRPGGRLVLTVPNIARHVNRWTILRGRNPLQEKAAISAGSFGGYGHLREYTALELRALFPPTLTVRELFGLNPYGTPAQRRVLGWLPTGWASVLVVVAERSGGAAAAALMRCILPPDAGSEGR